MQRGEGGKFLYFSDGFWSEFGGFVEFFSAMHHAVTYLGDFFKVIYYAVQHEAFQSVVQCFLVVFCSHGVFLFTAVVKIAAEVAVFLPDGVDVAFVESFEFPVKKCKAEGRGTGVEDEDGHV